MSPRGQPFTTVVQIETRIQTLIALIGHVRSGHYVTAVPDRRVLGGTLLHSGGGLLVLLVITDLNVFKPRGLTPFGWRKQRGKRSESDT